MSIERQHSSGQRKGHGGQNKSPPVNLCKSPQPESYEDSEDEPRDGVAAAHLAKVDCFV